MNARSEGLTIIELLVTIAVIGITFLALAMSQITGFRVTRDSTDAAIARDAATEWMEIIRAYGYENFRNCTPSSSSASTQDLPPTCRGSAVVAGAPQLTLRWTVDNDPFGKNSDPPALVGVTVTVTNENSGLDYTLFTYLSCADADFLSATQVQCPNDPLIDWVNDD